MKFMTYEERNTNIYGFNGKSEKNAIILALKSH